MSAASAVARLNARLIRRGVLWLALVIGFFVFVEALTYENTYPDDAARAKLVAMSDEPALRMLQGVPHAVDTVGGFVAWDAGWMLSAIIGIWAMLVTGRLLRGEEESGRAELMQVAPVRASRIVVLQVAVVAAALAVLGVVTAVILTALGTGVTGSVVFGAGLAGFGATCAGIAAIAAQLLPVRRRVSAVATAAFGVFFVLRMAANSADARGGLRWATPFGWLDELHAYRDPNWPALLVLLLAPVILFGTAVRLRRLRDTGGALIAGTDHARARLRYLGGPTGFAWRTTRGLLLGWLLGVAAYAYVTGALVATVLDLIRDDPNYQKTLEAIGWDEADAAGGFIGLMGILIGLLIALFTCWRIGAAQNEEGTGRLDHVLARPVTRSRWLSGHLLITAAAAVLIATSAAVAMWAGAASSGADVSLADTLAANLNPLPVVALACGVAVLLYGAFPRLTVPGSAAVAVTAYLIEMVGPGLNWPDAILSISPFHHLASVPAAPYRPVAAAVMTAVALAFILVGHALFTRRDLTGD
ncbi:ABC transporter permease [Spirillospora albida]|uniref:ABC transporter permease n=1 Tax=Spirillospora albida TaxID=58123 RepID=UPI0004C1A0C9|nr:hypothetical protein [Spirillospora albida]